MCHGLLLGMQRVALLAGLLLNLMLVRLPLIVGLDLLPHLGGREDLGSHDGAAVAGSRAEAARR